jgi:T5orf172 domain-containing protein
MSHQSPTTMDSDWITIFTLQIDFETKKFTPSSQRKLSASNLTKTQCNCAHLSEIHPSARLFDLKRGLFPSRIFKAHFLFTAPGKLDKAELLCVLDQNRNHEDLTAFCLWMLSLVAQLSDLCESDHSRNEHTVRQDVGLRPFINGRITRKNVCKGISELLRTPLNPSEIKEHGMGYIYVLRSQMGGTTFGELKIGFSKHHPEHRSHELARCLAKPEIICHTPLLPHAKRLESIIHTELQACRKVQSCPKCDKNHQEWFTLSHAESREVVTRWGKWILQQPYVDGQLNDPWRSHLTKENFDSVNDNTSLPDFWEALISNFPTNGIQGAESQRIGKYLNDCYWDVAIAKNGLGQYGKEFCDGLRADMPQGWKGRGTSFEDLMDAMALTTEALRAYQEKDSESEDQKMDLDNFARFMDVCGHQRTRKDTLDPDMPINEIFREGSQLATMYHSETKLHHILKADKSPGTLTRLIQCATEYAKSSQKDLPSVLDSFRNLKTGVVSVSDPALGVTESPLGDATLLPVLALKDLKYLNGQVANWVGMNPTNTGFQLLQEAYQEGKWIGNVPQFALPKVFRKAGYTNLSTADKEPARRKGGNATKKTKSNTKQPQLDPDTFQLTRRPDGDEFRLLCPLTDELTSELVDKLTYKLTDDLTDEQLQQTNRQLEELRLGGGLERLQKAAAKRFRKFGLSFDFSSDGETSDSDSEISSCSSSSGDEEDTGVEPSPSSVSPSVESKKRTAAPSSMGAGFTPKKAKLWLESL